MLDELYTLRYTDYMRTSLFNLSSLSTMSLSTSELEIQQGITYRFLEMRSAILCRRG
jgi:hypothetical protein